MKILNFLDEQINFARERDIEIEKVVMGSKTHEAFLHEITGDSEVEIEGIKSYRGVPIRRVEQLTTITVNFKLN